MPVFALSEALVFPPPHLANPEGILAVGGDLSVNRLLLAYQSGIFPWYSEGDPIIWWSPDPRFILYPEKLKVSKSMRQVLRKGSFQVTYDQEFGAVINHCQKIDRRGQRGSWITAEMKSAYFDLHQAGYGHSVEVWHEGKLVGGLYGISLGKVFFGESMFSLMSNASKTGFIFLVKDLLDKDFQLIDCQVYTSHLESLGAEELDRKAFLEILENEANQPSLTGNWGEVFDRKKKSDFA